MSDSVVVKYSICFDGYDSRAFLESKLALSNASLDYEFDFESNSLFVEIRSQDEAKAVESIINKNEKKDVRLFCSMTSENDNDLICFPAYILDLISHYNSQLQVSVIFL